MQQPGCSSRELCRVKRSNLKKLNTVCFQILEMRTDQQFEVLGIVVGWGGMATTGQYEGSL